MKREDAESLIQRYVEGWRKADRDKILDTLAPDCVIVESHGPTYRGRAAIGQWIDTWFEAGGTVDRWEITSLAIAEDAAAFEWSFACTWLEKAYDFEGASIVRFKEGKIAGIREYCTTAPLYEWDG